MNWKFFSCTSVWNTCEGAYFDTNHPVWLMFDFRFPPLRPYLFHLVSIKTNRGNELSCILFFNTSLLYFELISMKYYKNIPDCFDAVKHTIRIPMVIVILRNIQIAQAVRASLDIDQKQRFLTKKQQNYIRHWNKNAYIFHIIICIVVLSEVLLRTVLGLSMTELEFEFFVASIVDRCSVLKCSFDIVL